MIPKVFMFKYDAAKEPLLTGSDPRIKILKLLEPANLDNKKSEEKEVKAEDLLQTLVKNNDTFNELLNQMPVPLRFCFLALLSVRKATIFSGDLLKLMKHVLEMKINTDQNGEDFDSNTDEDAKL